MNSQEQQDITKIIQSACDEILIRRMTSVEFMYVSGWSRTCFSQKVLGRLHSAESEIIRLRTEPHQVIQTMCEKTNIIGIKQGPKQVERLLIANKVDVDGVRIKIGSLFSDNGRYDENLLAPFISYDEFSELYRTTLSSSGQPHLNLIPIQNARINDFFAKYDLSHEKLAEIDDACQSLERKFDDDRRVTKSELNCV